MINFERSPRWETQTMLARNFMITAALLLSPAPILAQADADSEVRRSTIADSPTARRNAEIVRRLLDAVNRHDVEAAGKFWADDTVIHGIPRGRTGVRRILTDVFATFPDWRQEIIDLVAVGDDVVIREIVSGTHQGTGRIALNGGLLVNAPPTGKKFKVQAMHWYTLDKDGLIIVGRANRDDVGMMQHLGLLPLPPGGRRDLPPNPNNPPTP
jgi:predicted ester cyclase